MPSVFDKDNDPLADQQALQRHIQMALAVQRPAGLKLDIAYQLVKRIFDPMVIHAERLPDRPCLFVGNHSLFALDGWILAPIMLTQYDRFLRGLGDRFLFASERLAETILNFGGVMGHPEVCSALMRHGHDLVVFPGGAHEAVKPAHQLYELQWKERYGFVKLAAQHGYTIMPFAMVGPDEFYDHLLEGEELPETRVGQLLQRLGVINDETRSDMLPPIPIGALGTLVPKPQRCYLGFAEPLDLADLQGKRLTKRRLQSVRSQVAERIEQQLAELLLTRERNKGDDALWRRILTF